MSFTYNININPWNSKYCGCCRWLWCQRFNEKHVCGVFGTEDNELVDKDDYGFIRRRECIAAEKSASERP
jgi:hypothetical protein